MTAFILAATDNADRMTWPEATVVIVIVMAILAVLAIAAWISR